MPGHQPKYFHLTPPPRLTGRPNVLTARWKVCSKHTLHPFRQTGIHQQVTLQPNTNDNNPAATGFVGRFQANLSRVKDALHGAQERQQPSMFYCALPKCSVKVRDETLTLQHDREGKGARPGYPPQRGFQTLHKCIISV
eukprot:scaffold195747_cov18-Tisochrysis_lutea.AAC.1